jgi:phenylacetic acid degradation operon negative regulatory protein
MSADAAIAALLRDDEPRTWSLIVTLFGDLARRPGAEISGPALSAITGRIGVRPEAMRVALHRLRRDGWIIARRAGRISHYRLSDAGRAEAEAASTRIYARDAPAPEAWHVLIAGPDRRATDGADLAASHVVLAPGAWLGTGQGADRAGYFRLAGTAPGLPDWLRAAAIPADLAAAYVAFDARLAKAGAALDGVDPARLPDLDRAALRGLIVHGWRRLVLRHPPLPDALAPIGWAGPRARARVATLLARVGCPALAHIGAETAPANPAD